jgi:hypothetical protein
LGWAGDGGEQDCAEHKANGADHGKDKTLPFGQALAFGRVMRAKNGRVASAKERLIDTTRGAAGSPPLPILMRRTAW